MAEQKQLIYFPVGRCLYGNFFLPQFFLWQKPMAKKKHQRRKYGETIEGISSGKQQQKATDMIQDHLERKDVFCYTVTFGPNAFTSASCKQRNWLSTWCPSKFSKTKLQWKSYWCHSSLRSLLIESTVPFLVVLLSQVQIHHFRLGNMVDTYESHVLPFAAEAL